MKQIFIPQRTQPPHIGHMSMLEAACKKAKKVVIGVGTSNVIDERNPYTADEREQMVGYSLREKGYSNYEFVRIPDFETDEEWVDHVKKYALEEETVVVSGNDWVKDIFTKEGYEVLHPKDIIEHYIDINATKVRELICKEDPEWMRFAASGTLRYFEPFGGVNRIRQWYVQTA